MLRGIYSAASGLVNTQLKQDVTSHNIANLDTTGFKQDKAVSKPFSEVMLQNRDRKDFDEPRVQKLGNMVFGVESGDVYTDFKQGDLISTGNDLDFAINGKGFFAVRYFDGIREVVKYTRDGSFHLDSEGRIVNSGGGFLLARNAETGWIEPVTAGDGKVLVDKEGRVFVDDVYKYSLIVNDFENYDNIIKDGSNNYGTVNDYIQPVELSTGSYEINQGKLEKSNVDISNEMVSMITNLRSFQANQRVLQSIDETLGKAVNEIGTLR